MDTTSCTAAVACCTSSPTTLFGTALACALLLRGGGSDSGMFEAVTPTTTAQAAAAAAAALQKHDGCKDVCENRDPIHSIHRRLLRQSLLTFIPIPWKSMLGITVVALYALNQSHLLPRPLSGLVSRALFWPTLPITVVRRNWGRDWTTEIDDTVLMGGAPFGFCNIPRALYHEQGVRGVVNMCEEYRGPVRQYRQLTTSSSNNNKNDTTIGMIELRLPTTDHFEPSVQSLQAAVAFIQEYANRGERVYVHCRAGHGRSAAVVMAWIMVSQQQQQQQQHAAKYKNNNNKEAASLSQTPPPQQMYSSDIDAYLKQLNENLCQKRNVRKTLWKQPNLRQFHQLLLEKMRDDASDNVAVADETQQQFLEQQRDDTVSSVAASAQSAMQHEHDL